MLDHQLAKMAAHLGLGDKDFSTEDKDLSAETASALLLKFELRSLHFWPTWNVRNK